MSQIGILNGSYRAFSGSGKYYRNTINDFTFTCFLLLGISACVLVALFSFFSHSDKSIFLFLGAFAGISSLISTYVNNSLLADQKIKEVNAVSAISNIVGYSSLVLVYINPVWAVLSFIVQPILFILLAIYLDHTLIPKRIVFSLTVLKYLLNLGFIPYLTALFAYINLQVERWTIVLALGIEQLGHFYLAIAFASLFSLFPTSVNHLYFPRMIRANSENRTTEFSLLLRNYNYILLFYCVISTTLLIFIAPILIDFLFPQHYENLQYVYYTLPGLIAITMGSPYLVYFNALVKLRPLLLAYGLGSVSMILFMFLLFLSGNIALKNVAIADSVANIVIALVIVYSFVVLRRSQNQKLGDTTPLVE